jgi:DNA-binding SARP family transcriptional activator
MLKVRLLGQFEVRLEGEQVDIRSRPAQSLFAYLILRSGTSHRREKLAGLLWPDSDESNARANLRHALWRIRRAIGDGYINADKITIEFDPEVDYWLDADVLESEDGSAEKLLSTVAVYGGELLPGFFDDWVVLDRERFRTTFETRIQEALNSLIERQEWTKALEWGERWIALGDVPEPAFRALMVAHAGMGDTAGVAAVNKRCVTALREELGVEPSEQTQRTFEFLSQGGLPSLAEAAQIATPKPESSSAAIHALMKQWREQGVEQLDVVSLAMVHAAPGDVMFEGEEAALLIRSALAHDVDVEPWLRRTSPPEEAVEALMDVHASNPQRRVRMNIVDALRSLDGKASSDALMTIGTSDDSGEVQAEAALEVARRGNGQEIVGRLLSNLDGDGKHASLHALTAIADVFGYPEDLENYPVGRIRIALWQRRWASDRSEIIRRGLRFALAGGITMAIIATVPMVIVIVDPSKYASQLVVVPLPAWIMTNALLGFLWGGLHGGATGFLLNLADSLSRGGVSNLARFVIAGVAGLVQSFFIIFVAAATGVWASQPASVYIPVYIFSGFLMGATLTLVIAKRGTSWDNFEFIRRVGLNSLLILAISSASIYISYGGDFGAENAVADLTHFMLYALMFPLGISLGYRTQRVRSGARVSFRTA